MSVSKFLSRAALAVWAVFRAALLSGVWAAGAVIFAASAFWGGGILPALAAPCCGGGSAAPSIVTGDDQGQIALSLARSSVIGDARESGDYVFRSSDQSDVTWTYRVDGAWVFADRVQFGASVPVVTHSLGSGSAGSSATQLGDVALTAAYEVAPLWTYSDWRPKGIAYLQVALPTGKSIYDATQSASPGSGVDAAGRGFYTTALGSIWIKKWAVWDAYATPELRYSFARSFPEATVGAGWEASAALGVGASPFAGDFRLGLRLQPNYRSSRAVASDGVVSRSGAQLFWDTAIEGSYLIQDQWSASMAYSDQTLLGPASHTTLSRAVSVGLQYRQER